MSLHEAEYLVKGGTWWACHEPERPGGRDSGIVYDERCPRCAIKAAADVALFGDMECQEAIIEPGGTCWLSEIASGAYVVEPSA